MTTIHHVKRALRRAKRLRRKNSRRSKLFIAQQGKCWLCGGKMRLDVDLLRHPDAATFDHIKPRAEGGTNRQDNIILAHKRCNSRRGSQTEVRAMRCEN